MSLISPTKFGDCANAKCGLKNTSVVKVGKETYCLNCRTAQKNKVQITKANQRNQVRGLYDKQSDLNGDAASRAAITQDLDYYFSRIVRLRAANEHNLCECYTCGKLVHWSLIQCGHFLRRQNTLLRWDFRNARPQDKHCNEGLGGNEAVFAEKLNKEEYGLADILREEAREVNKFTTSELSELLIDIKGKYKLIEYKIKK